jgi:hypothetical protein
MNALTGRACLKTSNGVSGREANRRGCRIAPRSALKCGVFFRFYQYGREFRLSAIFGRGNKCLSAEISRACHLVTLFGTRARRTMLRRTERRTNRRNQNRQQSKYRSDGALRPARAGFILLVHAYLLTLRRCNCLVNNALLRSSQRPSALLPFAPCRQTGINCTSAMECIAKSFLAEKWWGWRGSNSRQPV